MIESRLIELNNKELVKTNGGYIIGFFTNIFTVTDALVAFFEGVEEGHQMRCKCEENDN